MTSRNDKYLLTKDLSTGRLPDGQSVTECGHRFSEEKWLLGVC